MRVSRKHGNQRTVELYDFTGGLNTSVSEEQIAPNELAVAVNFDVQAATGLLKTVSGTKQLYRIPEDSDYKFKSATYDMLNNHIVCFADNGTVFSAPLDDVEDVRQIGRLSGKRDVVTTVWESGLAIASGGHLQYCAGYQMKTLNSSPTQCNGCYTRNGRVMVFNEERITFSAVGDEEGWNEETNDDSSSKWLEVGYKMGGRILGLVNMSSDTLVIQDNGMLFRLIGEYPNWEVKEIARDIDCRSSSSYCNVVNNSYILSQDAVYGIVTTQEYGDMRALTLSEKVKKELLKLGKDVKMRYVAPLNQIWFIDGTPNVLMLDLNVNGYYHRAFNSPVVDVVDVDEKVYVIKPQGFDVLDEFSYTDEGSALIYALRLKTEISHYNFLIKRVTVACTGYGVNTGESYLRFGKTVKVPIPIQSYSGGTVVYDNENYVVENYDFAWEKTRRAKVLYSNHSFPVYDNLDYVFDNEDFVVDYEGYSIIDRAVRYRNPAIPMTISGRNCRFILNKIRYDVAEV